MIDTLEHDDKPFCRAGQKQVKETDSSGRSSGSRLMAALECLPVNLHSGFGVFKRLAEYSGGPATDLHRFPFACRERVIRTVEVYYCESDRQAANLNLSPSFDPLYCYSCWFFARRGRSWEWNAPSPGRNRSW